MTATQIIYIQISSLQFWQTHVLLTFFSPKCRHEYPYNLRPSVYKCFCGKTENPEDDPWQLPHSCGETCHRPLKPDCGHHCLLLCHPGIYLSVFWLLKHCVSHIAVWVTFLYLCHCQPVEVDNWFPHKYLKSHKNCKKKLQDKDVSSV